MRPRPRTLVAAALLAAGPAVLRAQDTTAATPVCRSCAEWNAPQRPFRIHGDSSYVGTHGLSAVLVTSPQGHVLLDGALPESAPHIAANVRALGFCMEDVRLVLDSHAHYDHAGGIAALQRASGATVAAHRWSAAVMRRGTTLPEDPQHGLDRYAAAGRRRLAARIASERSAARTATP